jgi:hypothetical protein
MAMTVTDTLRRALNECGASRAEVSRATGIGESVLSRFVGGATLTGANLDTLAEHLGLALLPVPGRAAGGNRYHSERAKGKGKDKASKARAGRKD